MDRSNRKFVWTFWNLTYISFIDYNVIECIIKKSDIYQHFCFASLTHGETVVIKNLAQNNM